MTNREKLKKKKRPSQDPHDLQIQKDRRFAVSEWNKIWSSQEWDVQRKAVVGSVEDALVWASMEQSKLRITEGHQTRHLPARAHLSSKAVILAIVPCIY